MLVLLYQFLSEVVYKLLFGRVKCRVQSILASTEDSWNKRAEEHWDIDRILRRHDRGFSASSLAQDMLLKLGV